MKKNPLKIYCENKGKHVNINSDFCWTVTIPRS